MTAGRVCTKMVIGVASAVVVLATTASGAGAATAGHVAGYSAPPSASPTQTATATLVVPKVSCKKVPAGGFQGVLFGVRLQVSGANSGGGVVAFSAPTLSYVADIQIAGSTVGSGITINAGDTVTVTASEGPGGTTVTLVDGGQNQTASGPGGTVTAEDAGAIAVNCIGSSCSPPPQATLTKFSAVTIDGVNLTAAHAGQGVMVDAAGQPEMQASKLTRAAESFTVKWLFSCGVGPGRC